MNKDIIYFGIDVLKDVFDVMYSNGNYFQFENDFNGLKINEISFVFYHSSLLPAGFSSYSEQSNLISEFNNSLSNK